MMATSPSEIQSGAVASADIDDGQGDDLKYDKKKKFKPFQKMKNFFRGGSKKARFKTDDQKSHSVGALHHKMGVGDDDDDGGFLRGQTSGLAGSRSISEDSVFKPELKESPIGVLQGHAVSMENIDTSVKPLTRPSYQESDQSLRSMEGVSDEEPGSMRTSKRERSLSTDSLEGELDFSSVEMRSTLSNEAAKHRISVKPKSRRLSSKVSMRRRERSPGPGKLDDVEEEKSTHSVVMETEEPADLKQVPHKTVISTTIPIGTTGENVNVIPITEPKERSSHFSASVTNAAPSYGSDKSMMSMSMYEPNRSAAQDIPGARNKTTDDLEKSRPRSISPLSTSPPMTTAMLQGIKLKSRPPTGAKPVLDTAPKSKDEGAKNNTELAKAFDRAKRISRKFDEGKAEVVTQKSEVKPVEKQISVEKDKEKEAVVVKPQPEVVKPSETITKPVDNTVTVDKNVFSVQATNNQAAGVSFVLKKEPQVEKPAVEATVTTVTSFGGKVETSSIVSTTTVSKEEEQVASGVKRDKSESIKDIEKDMPVYENLPVASKGNSNKLASPREEYRLKRQNRSKTLPVYADAVDKATEEKKQSSNTNRRSADYENVVITPKSVTVESAKRSSWAPQGLSSTRSDSQPEWIKKAQQMEHKTDTDKHDQPKEVKIEPAKSFEKAKSPERTPIVSVASSSAQSQMSRSFTTQSSAVKQDKPASSVVRPSSGERPGYLANTARAQYGKPSSPTKTVAAGVTEPAKPLTTSPTKTAAGNVSKFSGTFKQSSEETSKPAVSSTGGFRKPQPTSADKPPVQGTKPSISAATRPPIHAAKPTVATANVAARFGGVSKATDSSTPRPGMSKQSSTETNKPSTTPMPSAVKTAAANNKPIIIKQNDTKENKETPKTQTSAMNKGGGNQTNNVHQNNSPSISSNRLGSIKSRTGSSDSNSGDITARRFGSSINKRPAEMKIEIIDKGTPAPAKNDQKTNIVQMRDKPKTTPETCADLSSNRPSKVLDMVKSFQKLQV